MSEPIGPQQLRRTWMRGYRASDVEIALARTTLTIERLQHELETARQRTQAMQAELAELQSRVESFRLREAEVDRSLEELRRQRDLLEREAQARSEVVVGEAERRAAAIRSEGLRQVGELQQQVEQLLETRSSLTTALRKASAGLEQTIERLSAVAEAERPAPPVSELTDHLARWRRDDNSS